MGGGLQNPDSSIYQPWKSPYGHKNLRRLRHNSGSRVWHRSPTRNNGPHPKRKGAVDNVPQLTSPEKSFVTFFGQKIRQ